MADPAPSSGIDVAAEVAAAMDRYRLQLDGRRYRGRAGGRRGLSPGSSLEFFDFRDYAPGDDLRHVDWRGFARTDQLRIRLSEEEVAPWVDVLVDTSLSMAVTGAKERATRALVAATAALSQREGLVARVQELGGGRVDSLALRFAGTSQAPSAPRLPLKSRAVRVLVTDALWEVDPTPFLRRLMASASRFITLQLLDPWEVEPAAGPALTLVDCEGGRRLDLAFSAAGVLAYRARLQRLCQSLRDTIVGGGGSYVRVTADSLSTMCARDLLPAGILVPA